jgi:putative DNA primase/helicase
VSDDRLWKKGGKNGVCQLRADAVPPCLAALPQWVAWYWDFRYTHAGERKLTKIPMDPRTRLAAATNDPDTWGTFAEAVDCHVRLGNGGGVGFVFTSGDPFCGIDLDKCRDPQTGELTARAKAVLARFPTYAEVSPSGTGVKLLFRGILPEGRNRKDGIEVYDRGRFFTVTGDVVADQPIDVADCQDALLAFHAELFPPGTVTDVQPAIPKPVAVDDGKLLEVIRKSKNAEKFGRLWAGDTTGYGSGSEADLALVNYLIGYTGGDYDRTDGLFRQSGLYRDKWERKDYRTATMDTAMSDRTWFYDPHYGKEPKATAHAAETEAVSEATTVQETDVATLEDLKAAGADLRFLWPGWIQHAVVNILAAEGGTGKTRFMADILRRIKTGQPWPDGAAMTHAGPFRSLWVLADNHHAEMVDLGEKFGITDMVWVSAYKASPFEGTLLESLEDWKSLGAIIRAVRPHMLIVDTIGNATSKNLSRQEDAMEFYRPLQVLARKYDMPVMCLTHLAAGGNVLGRRGQEKVRVVIKMDKPDPNDDRRKIEIIKSNQIKPKPLAMSMRTDGADYDDKPPEAPETDEYGKPKGDRPRGRPGAKRELCESWLRDLLRNGQVPAGQLLKSAERGGFSKSTLYRALEEIGAEKVHQDDEEWWKWDES